MLAITRNCFLFFCAEMLVATCFGQLFQPAPGGPGGLPANLSGWMANQSVVPHPSAAPSGPMGLGSPNNAGCLFICECFVLLYS